MNKCGWVSAEIGTGTLHCSLADGHEGLHDFVGEWHAGGLHLGPPEGCEICDGRANDDKHWHRGPSDQCGICTFAEAHGLRQLDAERLRQAMWDALSDNNEVRIFADDGKEMLDIANSIKREYDRRP